jgi:hypothetical protein
VPERVLCNTFFVGFYKLVLFSPMDANSHGSIPFNFSCGLQRIDIYVVGSHKQLFQKHIHSLIGPCASCLQQILIVEYPLGIHISAEEMLIYVS